MGTQRHLPALWPSRKSPVSYCVGGWVSLVAYLDRYGKEESLSHTGVRTLSPSSPYRLRYADANIYNIIV